MTMQSMDSILRLEARMRYFVENGLPEEGSPILRELQDAVVRLTRPEREARVLRLLEDSHGLLSQAQRFAETDGGTRNVSATVILFSGGNDSTTLAHIFRHRATHVGMANTGVGIEQTRQYVRDTAASWGLPVVERGPLPGEGFRELVLGQVVARTGPNKGTQAYPGGFPGPGAHGVMFQRLKERAFEQIRNHLTEGKPRENRVVFLAGRRATESSRRNKLAFQSHIQRKGSIVWCAPLINWTKMDLNTYRTMHPDVPRNQASDLIHMSGECLCGAFAHENEKEELRSWYPEVAAELDTLEREVRSLGTVPEKRCAWGWGWAKNRPEDQDCACRSE